MSIISSTDKRPVYIDSIGNPLTTGKLYYYNIGTTVPKTIFSDTVGTLADNPQLLDIAGRTDTQIFLDTGDYTVKAYKFNGTDPNTAPDKDWSIDNQWVESGAPLPSVASITDVVFVTTIPNLRLIDGNSQVNTDYEVMGYWTDGDIFPRTYHWSPTELGADNQGTIIRNPLVSTGAFVLSVGNTDVMDCRIFGIISNRASSNNGAIASMVTTVQATPTLPQTIYFPRGIYEVVGGTQYYDTNVIFDNGCQFKSTSGDHVIGIRSTFANLSTSNIKSITSVGNVYFNLLNRAGQEEIDPRWYGASLNGTTDDAVALFLMLGNIYPNYPIKLNNIMRLASAMTAGVNIINPIHTYNMGGFKSDQSLHTINFKAPGYIKSENRRYNGQVYPVFYPVNRGVYYFTDYLEVKASWFANPVDGNPYAEDVDTIIKTNNTVINGGNFVIDYDCTFTTLGMDINQSDNWNFNHIKGRCSTQGSNYIYLPSMDASANAIIFTNGYFCVGGNTYSNWWEMFDRGVISAFASSATLDLNGTTNVVDNTIFITLPAIDNVKITNGSIVTGNKVTIFNCIESVFSVEMERLNITDTFGSTVIAMDSANANMFRFKSSYFSSTNSTNSALIRLPNDGNITYVTLDDSYVLCKYLVNEPTLKNSNYQISNNKRLWCDAYVNSITFMCSNNNINGSTTGVWDITSVKPAKINDNVIESCDIFAGASTVNSENVIQHIIDNNTFIQSDTKWSRVLYKARLSNVKMFGTTSHSNNVTGVTTTGSGQLFNFSADGGTWNNGGHYFSITGNSGGTANVIVNSTEGIALLTFTKSSIPVGKRSAGDIFMVNVSPIETMLYVPGATVHGLYTGNFHYQYNNVASAYPISQYLAYLGCNGYSDDPLQIVGRCLVNIGGIDTDLGAVQIHYKLYTQG